MRGQRPAELVVGSVQLGLPYGIANRTGKPARATALRLVKRAADAGVAVFDTARAYGDAEDRLGEALEGRSVRTITKLSPLSELPPDASSEAARAAVESSIEHSLAALRRSRLDCVLLHRASHLTACRGAIWDRLKRYVDAGTIASLGVSVQSPSEARQALADSSVAHLQLPFNLLDRRWHEAGVVTQIRARPTVTVHARSVFLQGVLCADDISVWPAVPGCDPISISIWLNDWVHACERKNAADLCLAYVRAQDWIDGVVVGMETEAQLEANLSLAVRAPLRADQCAKIDASRPAVPEQLLNPAHWPRR